MKKKELASLFPEEKSLKLSNKKFSCLSLNDSKVLYVHIDFLFIPDAYHLLHLANF